VSELPGSITIDRSLVSGLAWMAMLRWASQIISWAATFYAARMLTPGDFGLVAMAMLAIGLARMVQEFGLDAILVQDRSIVGKTRARLAGLLVAFGIFLFVLYALLSPLVAGFFKEPRVAVIVVALSLLFIFDSIQIVSYAQLQRDLQFRRLAIVMFVQVIVASVALATAVTLGLGLWSLVVNHLAGELAVTILLLAWAPYAIAWPSEIMKLARPLLQGWRMLVSRIVWYGYRSADQTIIGRMLGKDLLGAYSFALTFSTIAQQEIGSVMSRVVPGVFSEVQDRPEELRRYFLLLTEALTILAFPVTIGFALLADMLVPLILGDQWFAVVAPLRWLCLYSAFLSSQTLVSHVLVWTGQFRVNMWCSILAGVTIPLALLVAVRFGLEGIGMAWALVFPLVSVPACFFAFRTIRISVWDWLDSLWPATVGCVAMTIAVLSVRTVVSPALPLGGQTAIAIATGALVYPAVLWFFFSRRVRTMIDLAMSLRSRPAAGGVSV